MDEQANTEQRQTPTDENLPVETTDVTDTDLENIAGGGVGGNAVVNSGGGGYSSGRPS